MCGEYIIRFSQQLVLTVKGVLNEKTSESKSRVVRNFELETCGTRYAG